MHLEQRILVTGSSGFLGSHICERLLAEGSGTRGKHWIEAAKKRLHHNVLAIVLADKLARIARRWLAVEASRRACFKLRNYQPAQSTSVSTEVCERIRRDEGSVFPACANTGDPMARSGPSANEIAPALISIMARSEMLQSRAGYIDAGPLTPTRRYSLATHGRTIHSGHSKSLSFSLVIYR